MNKNDLRYIKTEKLIKETYLNLKKKNCLIKVSDLCKSAMINKSTFYAHYETIEALHRNLCKETTVNILDNDLQLDSVISNTRLFVTSFIEAFRSNMTIKILFDGDVVQIVNYIEEYLLEKYQKTKELKQKQKEIIFAIGGAAHLLMHNQSPDRVEATIKFIQKIIL